MQDEQPIQGCVYYVYSTFTQRNFSKLQYFRALAEHYGGETPF